MIKKWLNKLFSKPKPTYTISPKGEYFRKYCEKIVKGTWTEKDYIEDYEDHLKELMNYKQLNRINAAAFFLVICYRLEYEKTHQD